jgi:hypothetical protein
MRSLEVKTTTLNDLDRPISSCVTEGLRDATEAEKGGSLDGDPGAKSDLGRQLHNSQL